MDKATKLYYLITEMGTWDCDVKEFTDLDEAIDWYKDLTAAGINCIVAQQVMFEVNAGITNNE